MDYLGKFNEIARDDKALQWEIDDRIKATYDAIEADLGIRLLTEEQPTRMATSIHSCRLPVELYEIHVESWRKSGKAVPPGDPDPRRVRWTPEPG